MELMEVEGRGFAGTMFLGTRVKRMLACKGKGVELIENLCILTT